MRIALISDIHGNFVALQTVLADIETARVDQIACLGDVAANGAQPREVIEKMRALGCPMVRGNTDEWFLAPQKFDPHSEKDRRLMAMRDWAMEKLSPADFDFMRTFQPTLQLPLENGATLLGYHGSPQANTDVILATTSDDELARMIGDHRATVLAGGHTHQQMLRRYLDAFVITVGSVGMPFERGSVIKQDRHPPWSEYAIVESRGENLAIELRRVPLDVDAVVRAARASGMPDAERWVGEWGA